MSSLNSLLLLYSFVLRPIRTMEQLPRLFSLLNYVSNQSTLKTPFSIPWYDSNERRAAKHFGVGTTTDSSSSSSSPTNNESSSPLKPYLSYLCVTQSFRGQKIGKALVCVEAIARESWGALLNAKQRERRDY